MRARFPDMRFVQGLAIPDENGGGILEGEDGRRMLEAQKAYSDGLEPGRAGVALVQGMDRPEGIWIEEMREKSSKMTDFACLGRSTDRFG